MISQLADSIGNPSPIAVRGGGDRDYFGYDVWDADSYACEAKPHRFRIASASELPLAHAFAEAVMGMKLAPLSSLVDAHKQTGATAWLHACAAQSAVPTGIILLLPLTWDGEAALRAGRFDFNDPDLSHLCSANEEMASLYLWLCAGSDADARRNIMRTTNAWFGGACAHLRVYGRAASEEGVRAFASFGFKRLSSIRPDLFFLDRRR